MLQDGLWKYRDAPDVFAIRGGVRYLIPNPDELARVFGGGAWDRVQLADRAQIDAHPVRPWAQYTTAPASAGGFVGPQPMNLTGGGGGGGFLGIPGLQGGGWVGVGDTGSSPLPVVPLLLAVGAYFLLRGR